MSDQRHLTEAQATKFGQIFDRLLKRAEIETDQLALQSRYSQSAISLVRHGRRNLTGKMADRLAGVLGGSEDDWLQLYARLKGGEEVDVEQAVGALVFRKTGRRITGELTSCRLVNHQILEIFGDGPKPRFSKYFEGPEDCLIEDFDPSRIQPTSYDTCLGWIGMPSKGGPVDEVLAKMKKVHREIVIAPGEAFALATKELFSIPSFLEVDLAPASTLARESLHIGRGPIVDPFYVGVLVIDVQNIGSAPVVLKPKDAFLTVRFTLLDNIPFTDSEMEEHFNIVRYNQPA